MNLNLQRHSPIGIALPGEMFIESAHAAWALENNEDRIPAGTYRVLIYDSPHFGREVPLIDVPRREYIEIHWANWAEQLKGCIAVGQELNNDVLLHSFDAFKELFPLIKAAVEGEGCLISVHDVQPIALDMLES
jgi:hypothetical protein